MKAMIYQHYGNTDVLQLQEVPKPSPAANEVLIKIEATEVTKTDCEMRRFKFPVKWFWLPLRLVLGWKTPKNPILGSYFAGTVVAVGASVTRFNTGDQIFGASQLKLGAYGEYLCLPEHYTLVPKPENMSFAEAAAVPLGGLNALHFMNLADLQEGNTILINGAGGSIGLFAIQIAKIKGAIVTAVDRTDKEAVTRLAGADHFIDYTEDDFSRGYVRYDIVFNMVANASYSECIGVLKPEGRYLMCNARLSDMMRAVFTNRLTRKKAKFSVAGEKSAQLRTLKSMIEANQLRSLIDRVLPIEQIREAHRLVENEERHGAIVVTFESEKGAPDSK